MNDFFNFLEDASFQAFLGLISAITSLFSTFQVLCGAVDTLLPGLGIECRPFGSD